MNSFITGGAGYIGSATADALLRAGHSVGHGVAPHASGWIQETGIGVA